MIRLARCTVIALALFSLAQTGCAAWSRSQEASVAFFNPHLDSESLTLSPEGTSLYNFEAQLTPKSMYDRYQSDRAPPDSPHG